MVTLHTWLSLGPQGKADSSVIGSIHPRWASNDDKNEVWLCEPEFIRVTHRDTGISKAAKSLKSLLQHG